VVTVLFRSAALIINKEQRTMSSVTMEVFAPIIRRSSVALMLNAEMEIHVNIMLLYLQDVLLPAKEVAQVMVHPIGLVLRHPHSSHLLLLRLHRVSKRSLHVGMVL
jgi:hypothetical protein